MKSNLVIYVITLIIGSLTLCFASCDIKAGRQQTNSAEHSKSLPKAQASPNKTSSDDTTTVRFVAEATQVPELFSRGSYIDEQHAWVADGFEVKRTTDSGRTWQVIRISGEDEPVFGKMGGIYVMPYFITATRGWLNAIKGTWQTEDGGLTWRQIFTDHTGNPHFADEQHGWIATYTEKYQQSYVTKDGGQTWQPCGSKRILNTQTPHTSFFLTPQLGWAITSHTDDKRRRIDGVAHTTDGGCSWNQLWTGAEVQDQMYCEIYFLNQKEGWLAGCYGNGNLIRTKDGGKTWSKAQTPTDAWRATPVDIYFISSEQGWLITRATEERNPEGMYRTVDGGQTWQQLAEQEIINAFVKGDKHNWVPSEWKAGRLYQMLCASRATNQVK